MCVTIAAGRSSDSDVSMLAAVSLKSRSVVCGIELTTAKYRSVRR